MYPSENINYLLFKIFIFQRTTIPSQTNVCSIAIYQYIEFEFSQIIHDINVDLTSIAISDILS